MKNGTLIAFSKTPKTGRPFSERQVEHVTALKKSLAPPVLVQVESEKNTQKSVMISVLSIWIAEIVGCGSNERNGTLT